ncbi:MAG: hypothetical protein ACE5E5_11925 [Phycisphaerae bacterium]
MNRHYSSTTLVCMLLLSAGCGSPSFVTNAVTDTSDLLAMKLADYSGADVLAAQTDATTEDARTVSLPVELTQDALDTAVITLTPSDIAVTVDNNSTARANPTNKGRTTHARVAFRIAEFQEDACTSDLTVGPFKLTIEDGRVSVDSTEWPIPAEALALLKRGQLALCVATQADFNGTISLGEVAIETGRLHGHEERVTLCHVPQDGENVKSEVHEAHTITVGSSAVDAHLNHGDYLGKCDKADDQDHHEHDDFANDDPREEDGHVEAGDEDKNGDVLGPTDDSHDDAEKDEGNPVEENADGSVTDDTTTDTDDYNSGEHADDDTRQDAITTGHQDTGNASSAGPADGDNDAVADSLDQCPNTPPGETVDAAGCPCSQKDADVDGVDDCTDTCTGTSAGLSVDARGCAANQLDDDGDGVMNDSDTCANTAAGAAIDANGCHCRQLDTDGDGVADCSDGCPQTPAGEMVDADGCSTSQLTATVTVPGPTDIYLAGQPDGTTATWPFTGSTSNAPQHSPVMIDVSAWAGKALRFTATGVVVTGGNNAATPDGRTWVLRPNGLSQVFGLTAMMGYKEGTLVGVFLTNALPTPGLLPYMSTSGITTTTPLLQHVFVIGSSSQVVIPSGATRLFFGVAEQQGLVIDNSGSFGVTVEAVPHALSPADPLAATRFYVGDPNDPKDGIGWFDAGQWAFDYDFDGLADFTTTFGQAGDQPVVGDWNGDGLDEIGVMAPSALGNSWILDMNGNGVFDAGDATFVYGADAGSTAIAGDWDGDGVFELGFTTPDNLWHFDFNGDRVDGAGEALDTQYNRSIPVIGDWTGDGTSNLGNMNNGSVGWQFDLNGDRRWVWGTTFADQNWSWGSSATNTGVVGDWDGDGLDDPARYRVSTGDWYFTTRTGKGVLVAPSVLGFGANATPVAGSWATVRAAP